MVWRDAPAKGKWRVVIDAARVGAGGVSFTYADFVTDPSLGSLVIADAAKSRAVGAQWTVPAHVWRAGSLAADESLFALVLAQARTGDAVVPVGVRVVKMGGQ
jgi:hypothetical protein